MLKNYFPWEHTPTPDKKITIVFFFFAHSILFVPAFLFVPSFLILRLIQNDIEMLWSL